MTQQPILTEEDVRRILREELDKIFTAGMMYTATPKTVSKTPTPKQPQANPQTATTAKTQQTQTTPTHQPNPPHTVQDIRMMFPEDLDEKLHFEEKPDYVIIAPKKFLGSDNFGKLANLVRGLGGEYISLGKDSHFRIYKNKQGVN